MDQNFSLSCCAGAAGASEPAARHCGAERGGGAAPAEEFSAEPEPGVSAQRDPGAAAAC